MTDTLDTLGKRIRWTRGKSSQDEFAVLLGVHKETIGKYERDKIQPGADVLARLLEQRNVNTNWLLSGKGDPSMSANAPAWDINNAAMEAAMVTVDEALAKRNLVLATDKRAKLYTLLYKQLMRNEGKIEIGILNDLLDLAS